MTKSIFGLSENLAAGLAYIGLFFTGIIVLILERDNKYVRFHALQSVIWFLLVGLLGVVVGIFSWIPLIGWILVSAMRIIAFGSLVLLTVMALNGKKDKPFKIPIIGDICYAQIYK